MKKLVWALFALIPGIALTQTQAFASAWTADQIVQLRNWIDTAPEDALPRPDATDLEQALASGASPAIDRAATALALDLARLHLLGSATPAERDYWGIPDSDGAIDLASRLAKARDAGDLEGFFAGMKPRHPDYAALRTAYALETDPTRRDMLALNMERWRWLPISLGDDFVLVNTAAFEVNLWRDGQWVGAWPAIVGEPSHKTPVFRAVITGVTFNPSWYVPESIVRESVAEEVRRNPGLARELGFVWGNGKYVQKPGPDNALGRMKVVMPNSHVVYIHDTPYRRLFGREMRAFSHGCIRVRDALGFAATLLQGVRERVDVDKVLATERTSTISLRKRIPVYVAYFTVAVNGNGTLTYRPDIYGRDAATGTLTEMSTSRNGLISVP